MKKRSALARERLEGRLVGGKFSQLATYADLFERANDGIALIDVRNLEILETNGAFRDLLERDLSPEGLRFPDLFPEAARAGIEEWLGSETGVSEVATPDHRIFDLEFARVRLADYCEVIQLIAHDVTAERSRRNQLERQSLTDEMTGLANFRAFGARLATEQAHVESGRGAYCAILLDVDNFKHFNDRNGHPAGDETLRRIAKALRRVATGNQFVARYGGEEFVALVRGSLVEGEAFAEKIRAQVAGERFPFGEFQPLGKVSVSVGVAASDPGLSAAEVVRLADGALYESKRGGRNRVTVAAAPARKKAA